MRRLLALALAQTLVASSATVSLLHTHEYTGHDHPSHHHGPASHEHQHSAEPDHHASSVEEGEHIDVRLEFCDPGRHAASVKMGCAPVPQVHLDLAEVPGPTIIWPTTPLRSAVDLTDVRVHGPPFDPRIPSRAPPLIHLA